MCLIGSRCADGSGYTSDKNGHIFHLGKYAWFIAEECELKNTYFTQFSKNIICVCK